MARNTTSPAGSSVTRGAVAEDVEDAAHVGMRHLTGQVHLTFEEQDRPLVVCNAG